MEAPKTHGTTLWKLAIAGCALCWGASFFLMKSATDAVSPSWVIAIRFLPAALVLALIKGRSVLGTKREFAHGAFMGVSSWLGFLVLVIGLTMTTAGKGSFLGGVYCVMVPFVAAVVGYSGLKLRNLAAAAVCLAGMALISLHIDGVVAVGDILCLASSLIVAIQTVFVSHRCGDDDMSAFNFWEFLITGGCALVSALIVGPLPGSDALAPDKLFSWVFLSIVCTLVCMGVYNRALTHVDPSEGSLLASLEAPFGVCVAVLAGNEGLTPRILVGFALIMCAILISELGAPAPDAAD